MKHWFPESREPVDLDIIAKGKSYTRGIEFHWVDAFNYILEKNQDPHYVDPDFLYTIKCSHAPWDIRWHKTMKDCMFLKARGCKIDRGLLKLLKPHWEAIHGKKSVNLKKLNSEFFTQTIDRKYDHDWLHQFLAFGEEPLHNKIRPDLEQAFCSESLWNQLSHKDQIRCALEEIYVIATERWLGRSPKFAKSQALRQLIISMSTGWFNEFLIDNFEELLYSNDEHWLNKIKELK